MDDRSRLAVSVVLVVAGVILGVTAGVLAYAEDPVQANGVVIDFGDYETVWTEADVSGFDDPLELLEFACEENGFDLVSDGASVGSIDGNEGDWRLFAVYPGETEWVALPEPYDQKPSEFTVTAWSLSDEPTVAVDYSGTPVNGYSQKYRVVSLSPAVTEILASVKASNVIVGVDYYSDYPESIVQGKADGSIAVVGSYTSPSFELITDTNPDIVICDGSQTSQVKMADRLRDVGIDAVVTYPGESLESIMDNIYIVGTSIGYQLAAKGVIEDTDYVMNEIRAATGADHSEPIDTMISLEPDISPWISGTGTYLDSVVTSMGGNNVFSEWFGWVHITSDRIPYANPQKIIIVTTEYSATQEEYDHLYNSLSPQWQLTDAWRNGEVYVICEDAAAMVQRAGPRIAQTAELISTILYPGGSDIEVPKIIGSEYMDYLTFSYDMSYND